METSLEQHQYYMRIAINLAKKGLNTTTPNPRVGCVVVNNGEIIGEGFHKKAGMPHAEVNALVQAGNLAQGATAYITLEPCAHHGRTPPCADALIKAGISQVVIGSNDPNPQVAGQGVKRLQSAGITVIPHILEAQCNALNKGFLKRMYTGLPYVRVKMGMSLDGKIATKTGQSQWITSKLARQDVQYYRAQSCAVLSSSQTVIDDDPSLNVRLDNVSRQPIRVIIDSKLRTPLQANLFNHSGGIWLLHASEDKSKIKAQQSQATLFSCSKINNYLDLQALMTILGEQEINEVLVEAGGNLAGALLQANLVDELIIYQAPIILGHEAQSAFCLDDIKKLSDAYRFEVAEYSRIGGDIKLVFDKGND